MNNGDVGTQETGRNLQRFKLHVMEPAAEQSSVILFEVRLSVYQRGAPHHEIDVVSHQLRELVAVMPAKGRTECVWQVPNRLLIRLGLGVS
jgi:late competence protein required for DNA uptake (superfamily II DNA/RNA helicase)